MIARVFLVLSTCAALLAPAAAQEPMSVPLLEPGVHKIERPPRDGVTYRYTLVIPPSYPTRSAAGEKLPLVLALHYGGEVTPFYGHGLIRALVGPGLGRLQGIIVAPDSLGEGWVGPKDEQACLDLLDGIAARYAVDPERIVVTGFSMGGRGAWHLGLQHPQRFAAIVPVAGEPSGGENLQVPVFAVHSRADEVLPIGPTEQVVAQLKAQGREAQLEVLEEVTHYEVDRFVPGLRKALPWLWKQLGIAPEEQAPPNASGKPSIDRARDELDRIAKVVYDQSTSVETAEREFVKVRALFAEHEVTPAARLYAFACEVMAFTSFRALRLEESLPWLRKLIAAGRSVQEGWLHVGRASLMLGDAEGAREALERVREEHDQLDPVWKDWVAETLPLLPRLGEKAATVSGKTVDRKKVSTKKLKGVRLIHFYEPRADGSVPGLEELQSVHRMFRGESEFHMVSVCLSSDPERWKKSALFQGLDWPSLCDGKGLKGKAAKRYGVANGSSRFLVDAKGILRAVDPWPDEQILAIRYLLLELKRAREAK